MNKLICPHCGLPAAFTPIFLSDGQDYNFVEGTVLAASSSSIIRVEMDFYHKDAKYAIVCCQNCDGYFVAADTYTSSNWFTVYPILHKHVSEDILEPIKSQFEEANLCLAIGAYRACAAMCQVTLESLWRNKKVCGLNELRDSGIISQALFDRATEIRLWAGVIKHEPVVEPVSREDIEKLVAYLEAILHHVYVEPKLFGALRHKREQLSKGKTKNQPS